MSGKPKSRSIVKADLCLLPKPEYQELLARNHFRYLRKLFTRKSQLVMYLELVDIHILEGSIPPGLRINIKPPGYSDFATGSDVEEWITTIRRCSTDLIALLRQKYVKDIEKCETIIKYSMAQLTTIISSLRGVERKIARNDVMTLVEKISQECNKDLLSRFAVAEEHFIFDEAMMEDRFRVLENYMNRDKKVGCNFENELKWKNHGNSDEEPDCTMNISSPAHYGENERKWVEEQTDLMQRLTLDESKRTYDNIYPNRTSMSTDDYGFRQTGTGSTLLGSSCLGRTFIRSDTFSKNETKNRIQAEEEEMKYLEFINGVTNDILTRGIYSDRVLMQVMQRHMDQNRGRLNEGRMRHMLIKLQEDLGVPPDVSSRGFRTTSAYTSGYEEKSLDSSPKKRSVSPEGLKSASWKSDASSRSAASKLNFLESKHATKPPVSTSSNASHSGNVKRQKGILKTPGTSSGSDMEAKYVTLSSGDEDEKKARQKKISVENEALTTNTLEGNLDVKGTTHAIPCPSERTTSPTRPTPVKRSSIVSHSGSHIADSVSLDENQPDEVKSHNETPERTIPVTTKHGNISDGSDLDDF